jgi:hypothetical protein
MPKSVPQKLKELEEQLDAVDALATLAARRGEALTAALGQFRRNTRAELDALKKRLDEVERGGR